MLAGLTQGRMLERKGDYILDALDWIGRRVPWKAFADDDLNASNIVAGVPMVLV